MSLKVLIVGLTGFLISFGVLLVSLLLPMASRKVSRSEALVGIVPGALCSFLFLIVAVVGLILLLTGQRAAPARNRQRWADDADEAKLPVDGIHPAEGRSTVHLVLSLIMATVLGLASLVMLFWGVVGTLDGWQRLRWVRPGPYAAFDRGTTIDYFAGSVGLLIGGLCCAAAALILAFRRKATASVARPWYLFLVALLPLGIGIRVWLLGWLWGTEAVIGIILTAVCLVLALLTRLSVSSRLGACLTLAGLGYTCWMMAWLTATSPGYRAPLPSPRLHLPQAPVRSGLGFGGERL